MCWKLLLKILLVMSMSSSVLDSILNIRVNISKPVVCDPEITSKTDVCNSDLQVSKSSKLHNSHDPFTASLLKLDSSSYPWGSVIKSESPRIACKLIDQDIIALIDTGAEVSVLDENAAITAGIGISKTKETAQAANKLPLELINMYPVFTDICVGGKKHYESPLSILTLF